MEKKIIFTPVEPNRNLLWLHYREDQLVLEKFGSNGWESVGNSEGVTQAELEEALQGKADLVGGKVPAEQLPSYVDDVVEFDQTQLPETQISVIVGNSSYKNKLFFVNGSTSSSDRIGSQDKYPNMFVNFGENTSESDWIASLPEEGKIYINTDNNHSYRWSGTQLVDLDKQFSDEMAAAFTANWVTIDYSLLGTTLADDIATKVANASAAILTNNPNSTFPEIYLSKKIDNIVHFTKIRYAYVGAAYYNNFSYNITTKALSNPSQTSVVSPVQYCKDNGGTKTASEFLRDYMGAVTPNYFTISRSLLNTTLNDSNFTGVSNASILILEPSGEDTTPRVFIRGGYNADEVRFQEVSHSSNNYIAVRAIVLTKATKALSAEQTNVIPGGNSVYAYYTSAGGTKTEDEFKAKLVQLIDA
nr:MAG TPA: hypothetical protein [Crassvirales sp.]